RSREPLLACVAGFVLLGALLYVLQATYDTRPLDGLLERTDRALGQANAAEAQKALGSDYFEQLRRESERSRNRALAEAATEAEVQVKKPGADLTQLRAALQQLRTAAAAARERTGTLQPPPGATLSAYAGRPPNRGPAE